MPTYKSPIQPFDPVVRSDHNPDVFKYIRDNFYGAGQDSFTSAFAQNQELFQSLSNVMPIATGTLKRRWGYKLFNSPANGTFRRSYLYENETAGVRKLVFTNTGAVIIVSEDGLTSSTIFNPGGGAGNPRMVSSRDYAYFVDGLSADTIKWISTGATSKWGIVAPVTALGVGAPIGGGAITLINGRKYAVVFKNSTTGHLSDLSPFSASTGPLTSQNIPLSSIPVSADAQVDRKLILATLDGGDETTLYLLADLPNATTTLTDNIPDTTLVTQNIYLETDESGVEHGVADNTPPPLMTLPTKHKGRLYGAVGQFLYFSKNVDEVTTSTGTVAGRYEECWPATYFMDVSPLAETITSIFSDGSTLYIATPRHVWRLDGDGPTNFSKPEVIFNEVGVLAHESAKIVFVEGQPVGVMWITPDFRVISSNFSSYQDVGTPIQDVLNSINSAATANIWAEFFSSGAFDIYMLAIPTGANTNPDTLCVYDLRTGKWMTWITTDQLSTGIFNINTGGWHVASSSNNKLYSFVSTATQDRVNDTPVSFTAKAQTVWMHLGEPTKYKVLNELEVITGDSNIQITVEGASNAAQATTPNTVVSNTVPTTSPRGTTKLYLAGSTAKDRHYRFTFNSTGTATDVLDAFIIEAATFPV